MRKIALLIFILCSITGMSNAQNGPTNLNAVLVQLDYGYSMPLSDLETRFGDFNSVGTTPVVYFHKNHITVGGSFHYHFGRTIKNDVLSTLRDQYGQVIGSDTQPATIVLRMRGIQFGAHGSKIFNFGKSKTVHGIEVGLSLGYFQHWIRLQDDSGTTTQLLGDYSKGYDRLSGGMFYEPHIAYVLMSGNERLNLKIGARYTGAFTQSIRGYNYDTRMADEMNRNDRFISFFINYSLPIYFNSSGESRYY